MNSFKVSLASALLAVSLAPLAAMAEVPVPAACPTVEALKDKDGGFMGIDAAAEDNLYYAYTFNKYKTPDTWLFVIGVPMDQAVTNGDAMNKAKAALVTLSGTPTPLVVDAKTNDQWYCLYSNQSNYFAAAVTPFNFSSKMVHAVYKVKK